MRQVPETQTPQAQPEQKWTLPEILEDSDFQASSPDTKKQILQMHAPSFLTDATQEQLQSIGLAPPKQSIARSFWTDTSPELIGGTVGSVGGGLIAGPPGALVGGVALGAAGNMYSRMYRNFEDEPNIVASQNETLNAMSRNAAGEGMMAALSPIAKAALARIKPFAKSLTEAGREAIQFFDEFFPGENLGPNLAQATESKIADFAANASEGGILSDHVVRLTEKSTARATELAEGLFRQAADVIPDNEIGEIMIDTLKGRFKVAKAPAIAMRNEVIERSGGALVEKDNIIRVLEEELPDIRIASAKYQDGTIDTIHQTITNQRPAGWGATEQWPEYKFDVAEALTLRDRLRELGRTLKSDTVASVRIKRVESAVDRAIQKTVRDVDPDLLRKLNESNVLFRSAYDKYQPHWLKSLVDRALKTDAPELFVRRIMRDESSASHIKALKGALGDTPQWDLFRSNAYSDLLSDATKTGEGELSGKISGAALKELLDGIGPGVKDKGLGAQALAELFKPDELAFMHKFANALKVLQAKQSGGTGTMLVQFAQGGAGIGVPSAILAGRPLEAAGAAGVVFFGPKEIGRIITSKAARDAMFNGMRLPKTSAAAGQLTARLTTIMGQMAQREAELIGPPKPEQPQLQPGAGFGTY